MAADATLAVMSRWSWVVSFGLAVVACSKPSQENPDEAKQWPVPLPAAKDVRIPQSLSIAVTVDGEPKPAITAQTLTGAKPDFADEERKAWRIASLVQGAGPPGSVEASSPTGISVKFQHPTPHGFEPVLYLTRRGEVIVAALDPKDPFPGHHGQGGRLQRPGDSLPHVKPVAKLDIKRSTP
jgi:hypothetical protein